jgi:ribosomal protein L31
MTGEKCTDELSGCHVRCDDTGCRDQMDRSDYCNNCKENAHRDAENRCVCDLHWGTQDPLNNTDDCSVYTGPCHPRCEPGQCYGPDADTCLTCNPNAYWASNVYDESRATADEEQFCECIAGWEGIACTIYSGPCIAGCTSCQSATTCESCLPGRINNTTSCDCPPNYTGDNCATYTGTCPIDDCKVCLDDARCKLCVDNAMVDVYGRCHCNPFWSGMN